MVQQKEAHQICLEVFSEVFASISHEIKNTLAIINEHAGLLEDFALLGADEGTIEISRVQKATAGIHKQVKRSNKIVQRMNMLAHSTDRGRGPISGQELIGFCIELSEKKALAKNITVRLECPAQVEIHHSLPILEALLFLLLDKSYQLCSEGEEIVLSWQISGPQYSLQLAAKTLASQGQKVVKDAAIASLATHLQAKITPSPNGITLQLNKD
ncbi:ATP-binding protein [Desulfotalea psychrophila]|nr:hypothetical protein [Desulfotalea psychrophila]